MTMHESAAASKDLEHLARWLPVIEGRALVVAPRRADLAPRHDGRADSIDANDHALRRALEVLNRLEVLAASVEGPRHLLVLAYCYLWMGEVERAAWGAKFGGLDARIGMVFAAHRQRMAWLLNPAHTMGTMAAARSGAELREAAERAYAANEVLGDEVARLDLGRLREDVAATLADTERTMATLKRAREQTRVRGARR